MRVLAIALLAWSCAPEPPPVVEDSTGKWELRAPLPQGARQETATVALNGEVVVMGGFSGGGATVNTVEAYAPLSDSWRRLADLPLPLHHANAAVAGADTLVVAGFLTGVEFTPDGRVFIYDSADNSWSEGAPMPAGTQRGASGCAAVGDFVYVIGGLQGSSVATSSRYNVVDDTWEALPDLPVALDHLGAYAVNGNIYVVGGRTNGLRNHTTQVFELDVTSLTFSEKSPMPTSRGGFAGGVVNDEVIIVGGEGSDLANGVFPQTEAYNPASDTWRSLLDMRTPRHGMGAASVGNVLYVPGGADRQQFAAVDVNERFVPGAL
jgi:N-acetylneuraminic acid mutarotase